MRSRVVTTNKYSQEQRQWRSSYIFYLLLSHPSLLLLFFLLLLLLLIIMFEVVRRKLLANLFLCLFDLFVYFVQRCYRTLLRITFLFNYFHNNLICTKQDVRNVLLRIHRLPQRAVRIKNSTYHPLEMKFDQLDWLP